MPTVLVVSRDTRMRTAVRAELRERGVEALGLETADDVGGALGRGILPALVLIDGAELDQEPAREAIANLAQRVPVLVIESRISPAPDIPGAARLQRPLSVGDIVSRALALLANPAT